MDPLSDAGQAAADHADREYLRRALSREHGIMTRTAETLGISTRALHRRVIALGLAAWLRLAYPLSVRQSARRRREKAAGNGAGKKSTRGGN